MRKFLLAALALAGSVGLTLAGPARFVSYDEDKKEITVKEGKKGEQVEKVYKLTKDTKFVDGDDTIDMKDAVKKMTGEKKPKGLDVKVDGTDVTELKFMMPKKKKD